MIEPDAGVGKGLVGDDTAPNRAVGIDEMLDSSRLSRGNGQHRLGAEQAERALAEPTATALHRAQARTLLSLHRLRLGDYPACVRHGLLALEYFTEHDDRLAQSDVHCTLALAFTDTSLNETALRHVLGALSAARACASPLAEFWALSRSSLVHGAMDDVERAVDLGTQALVVAQGLHDPEINFVALNNLGDTYLVSAQALMAQGEEATHPLTQALTLMRQAATLAQMQSNPFNEALAHTNLVNILIRLGQHAEAQEHGRQGKALSRLHGYRSLEIDIDAQFAELARAAGHVNEATAMMEAQLTDPDIAEEPKLLAKLHRSLFEMHKAGGRFDRALEHHEQLHEVTLRMTVQTAGLQSQMLINTIEMEHARHELQRSQLEASMARVRAEELDSQAHTDPLTLLANRRALDRELPWMVGLAQTEGRPLCAAMIDFDHFKRVNDRFGHGAGDEVLTIMAEMLRTIIRGTDLAVRVGGEEFLLVFSDTGLDAAQLACERLLALVRAHSWASVAPGLVCTVSVGVAALEPDETVSAWLARADAALYEAKHGGRDQVFAAPSTAVSVAASPDPSSADPTSAEATSADPSSADPTSTDPTSAEATLAEATLAEATLAEAAVTAVVVVVAAVAAVAAASVAASDDSVRDSGPQPV
ncbi:GGDEF domain-containing protein [Cryobacterium melibiosiphilum]|uniref:GGDEF domain-containing protein n=1 Tax=Cryobacterium melibiosiphilum TaxID=995039 RepID=A0A3A5MHX1_9MICO|nr:GGDEF domain-containing protein [Cryobacterium melibiosiphilum]RJT89002.1 GGDEF domain-containing protein [Cryobacterium melibiosiphilum]